MSFNILVACEESQAVCIAFRNLGFNAFSCDIQECSGGHPEWHIKENVLPLLNGFCYFRTCDNTLHFLNAKWDLIIAHPPCTYLCLSGQKWCNISKYGKNAQDRIVKRALAVDFFMQFVNADCDRICIENPVGVMTRYYSKPTQYIRPCQFGHPVGKKTGLWLKGLPPLVPTNNVDIEYHISKTGRKWEKWFFTSSGIADLSERSKFRSKTFEGIAQAMADQWSVLLK